MLETLLLVSELGQEGRSGCGIRLSPTGSGPDVTRRGAEGVRGYVLPDSRICDTIRDPLEISSRGVMLRRPEEPLVASQPRRITSGLPQEGLLQCSKHCCLSPNLAKKDVRDVEYGFPPPGVAPTLHVGAPKA